MTALHRLLLLALAAVAGCGANGPSDNGLNSMPDMTPPAQPIAAPKNAWTWIPIDGAVCDDGTPTGIGVYLTDSPNLIIFLNGGGACWDYATCVSLNTSTHGPFGKPQFDQFAIGFGSGDHTIFSEADGASFKGWNKVYVPYCTGDVHAGNAVQTYPGPQGQMQTIHHMGYANVKLALARLGATIPSPARLVFSGASAGGFGSAFNYTQARATWPHAKSYLIDDSGPVLIDSAINDYLKSSWLSAWNLAAMLFTQCPDCKGGDWSLALKLLVKMFPTDRLALLSSERDATIRTYLLILSPADFEKDLNDLAAQRLDPTATFRYFFQAGESHTMLGDEANHTTGGINVADWISKMVTDDPAWQSVKP